MMNLSNLLNNFIDILIQILNFFESAKFDKFLGDKFRDWKGSA